ARRLALGLRWSMLLLPGRPFRSRQSSFSCGECWAYKAKPSPPPARSACPSICSTPCVSCCARPPEQAADPPHYVSQRTQPGTFLGLKHWSLPPWAIVVLSSFRNGTALEGEDGLPGTGRCGNPGL